MPYTQMTLPKDCTRLIVLMLDDAPAVAAAAARVAREVMGALGSGGVGCFNVARNSYHVTVFFLSLPTDPVAQIARTAQETPPNAPLDVLLAREGENGALPSSRTCLVVSLLQLPLCATRRSPASSPPIPAPRSIGRRRRRAHLLSWTCCSPAKQRTARFLLRAPAPPSRPSSSLSAPLPAAPLRPGRPRCPGRAGGEGAAAAAAMPAAWEARWSAGRAARRTGVGVAAWRQCVGG